MVFYKINYKQYGLGSAASIPQITSDNAVEAFFKLEEIYQINNWKAMNNFLFNFYFADEIIEFRTHADVLHFLKDNYNIIQSYINKNPNLHEKYNLKEIFVKFQSSFLEYLKNISIKRSSVKYQAAIIDYIFKSLFIFSKNPNVEIESMIIESQNILPISSLIIQLNSILTYDGPVTAEIIHTQIAKPDNSSGSDNTNTPEAKPLNDL